MLNWNLLQSILIIAIACSSVTVIFIQKTKRFCGNSKQVPVYSLIVNIVLGFFFSQTFSNISYINSLWTGLFSFLGADTLYKSLEGKLVSYSDLMDTKEEIDNVTNNEIINENNNQLIESNKEKIDDVIGEITYE